MKAARSACRPSLPEEQPRRATNWAKLPWLRWSFDAWLRDSGLRMCSPAARGVWMDLLAIAAASEEPGTIIIAGEVPSTGELAKLIGIRKSTFESYLADLEKRRVFSRDSRGAIYSRRMKREADQYLANVAAGSKGGNPALVNGNVGAGQQHIGSKDEARMQQGRGRNASDVQQDCTDDKSNIKEMDRNRVKGVVKADSDSDSSTEEVRENPGGFSGSGDDKVVSIETHRNAKAASSPKRRGVEHVKPTGTKEQLADEDRALAMWNTLAAVSFITRGSMTSQRRAKLRLRLKECGGLTGWQDILTTIENSRLWQGKTGEGTWKPCFDDVLKPRLFLKLLEGGYPRDLRGAVRPQQPDPNADLYARFGLFAADGREMGAIIDMEE